MKNGVAGHAFAPSSRPVEKFLTDLWSTVRVELPVDGQEQDGVGSGLCRASSPNNQQTKARTVRLGQVREAFVDADDDCRS